VRDILNCVSVLSIMNRNRDQDTCPGKSSAKGGVGCPLARDRGSAARFAVEEKERRAFDGTVKARIRLDFSGKGKGGRLFGGRSIEQSAEAAREQMATMFRNVPIQGVQIDDIDISGAVYSVVDEVSDAEMAYAPVVLQVSADSLEELIPFIVRSEFRKIDVLEPSRLDMDRHQLERLLFRLAEETIAYKRYLERKYNQ